MSIKIASMNFGDCDTILHNTPNGMKSITEVLGPNGEVYWCATKELTGVPPLSIKSNGTLLLDYIISGNMSQTGTPTPDALITPSECGERTRNLFDKDASAESGTVIMPNTVIYTDHKVGSSNGSYTAYLPCEPNTTYRITKIRSARLRCGTTSDVPAKGVALDDYVAAVDGNATTVTINASENAKYICFFYYNSSYDTLSESEIRASIQVEEGSNATPYEPYGYKLPINSRGKNLFDKDNAVITHLYPLLNGTTFTQGGDNTWSIIMPCKPNTTYVISKDILAGAAGDRRHRVSGSEEYPTVGGAQTFVDDSSETISGDPRARQIFTTTADTHWIVCFLYYTASYETIIEQIQSIQIEEGNDKTEYEPYVQPTLSNIYLGNAQTTRRIKKMVLTGDESIRYDSQNVRFYFSLDNSLIIGLRITPMLCSHYQCIDDGRPLADIPDNSIYSSDVKYGRWFIKDIDYTSAADLKSFLAQQYAAGTPVTIWYILATPETAVVNEPLRKIGDYADSVDYAQAQVSIPTLHGTTVIDVETTLKPSQMYIKYK